MSGDFYECNLIISIHIHSVWSPKLVGCLANKCSLVCAAYVTTDCMNHNIVKILAEQALSSLETSVRHPLGLQRDHSVLCAHQSKHHIFFQTILVVLYLNRLHPSFRVCYVTVMRGRWSNSRTLMRRPTRCIYSWKPKQNYKRRTNGSGSRGCMDQYLVWIEMGILTMDEMKFSNNTHTVFLIIDHECAVTIRGGRFQPSHDVRENTTVSYLYILEAQVMFRKFWFSDPFCLPQENRWCWHIRFWRPEKDRLSSGHGREHHDDSPSHTLPTFLVECVYPMHCIGPTNRLHRSRRCRKCHWTRVPWPL